MRFRLLSLCLGFVLLAVAAAPAAAQTDFKSLMRKTLDAWETMNPANAAPFYAKDATLAFFDIAPLKYAGWSEYAAGVQKIIDLHESFKFTINPDAQVVQRGNTAWGTATLKLDAVMKGGAKEAIDCRWTVIWEKRGKDWLIVHEHVSVPMALPPANATLYQRLGGYDAIAAVVDDFLGRLIGDPQLHRFFVGAGTDTQQHIRQLLVDQLCNATGGPCLYIGRTMKASHAGLGITENDWTKAVAHLTASLVKFHVGPREKSEVLGALSGLKTDIVEKK